MTRVKTMALIRNAIEEEIRESMDDGSLSSLLWLALTGTKLELFSGELDDKEDN